VTVESIAMLEHSPCEAQADKTPRNTAEVSNPHLHFEKGLRTP